jgi:hypothetical protein
MSRVLQNLFFVIGATAAGAFSGAGLAFLSALAVFPSGRDSGGAVGAFLFLAICGGVVGAIAGLVGSIRWIARCPEETWTLATWIGVAVGLAIGWSIRVSTVLDGHVLRYVIEWWPGMIIFLVSMGFLGGLLGAVAGAFRQRSVRESSE